MKKISKFLYSVSVVFYSVYLSPLKASQYQAEETNKVAYKGYQYTNRIENIRVQGHVSLGGSLVEHVRERIQDADQFVLAFMYRFNAPTLIKTLHDKYLSSLQGETDFIPLLFLDYNQYINTEEGKYRSYVRHTARQIPTTFVNLGTSQKSFHHKIIINKKRNERAFIVII